MAALSIRDVDEGLNAESRVRAAEHGRSMDAWRWRCGRSSSPPPPGRPARWGWGPAFAVGPPARGRGARTPGTD
ncbi:FitA-like ribbon-helix-helix domain-containing protein [Streptoalloteichus tenebrarius]|uniref:FitA-like ribbon-helix-helix domain-containing protein n=1 Tax=Streptoalloteichus tenebrarius (strain ATCC 17920 / DSM 40477 / JCM 4838 / CBS 697.72 / NBRC 16177 / NCIMB 11028 / NRRL B-12390 / A12253. 1 / ISP 5477) TaxID=1933 RepID=UPI0035579591